MDLLKSAELLAKQKHAGQLRKDGITTYSKHLEDVVGRLKGLGVVDEAILCAGWLHDTIEDTETSFEDLFRQFESEIAVLVLSLSKDMSLTRKKREQGYVKQLKLSSSNAKLIKLCDISANLSDIKNWDTSRSKKLRQVKKIRHYISIIKNDLICNTEYPKVITLMESVNVILKQFHLRPISLQVKI